MRGNADHEGDTSYIAVVDQDRNMISFTPSLHSGFGTKIVMGNLGFIFNCRGDYYSLVPGHANALEPGKRPRSTLQGTLVMKDGKPFMITGSPGGDDQCMRTIQTLDQRGRLRHERAAGDRSAALGDAQFPGVAVPAHHVPRRSLARKPDSGDVKAELEKRGHKVSMRGRWSMNDSAGIIVDLATGTVSAGADPRTTAVALAW